MLNIEHRTAIITKKMSALEGMRYISNKHQFQCQTREILCLYQHKKSPYKICRESYMHTISTPHSFITFKILPIIKVSTEMKLEKQTVGGQQKGKAGHTTTVHRRVMFSPSLHSQTQRGTANRSIIVWINWPNSSGAKRWESGRATRHWKHYIAKADLFGRKGDMSLSISYTFPWV